MAQTATKRASRATSGQAAVVTFDEGHEVLETGAEQLLALDAALRELARVHPRQASMVESRFFGGLDIPETAQLLDVSEATVLRDWRAARAWLAQELRP